MPFPLDRRSGTGERMEIHAAARRANSIRHRGLFRRQVTSHRRRCRRAPECARPRGDITCTSAPIGSSPCALQSPRCGANQYRDFFDSFGCPRPNHRGHKMAGTTKLGMNHKIENNMINQYFGACLSCGKRTRLRPVLRAAANF